LSTTAVCKARQVKCAIVRG